MINSRFRYRSNKSRLFLATAVMTAIVFVILLMRVSPALAQQTEMECVASIGGMPVNGQTITLDRDDRVVVEAMAPNVPTDNTVHIEFFGRRLEIVSENSQGGIWSEEILVDDYAFWGVGLYDLVWESRDSSGNLVCSTSASVKIDGVPWASVAGATALGVVAVSLSAITLTLKTTLVEGGKWVLKLVIGGKFNKKKETNKIRFVPNFSVSQTLIATIWGLLLSGGTLAALQQTALSPPTIELALELVVPFTVLSVLGRLLRLESA